MIPDLHPLAWLLYAVCVSLAAVFGFWLVRPRGLAEVYGPREVASARWTRIVAAVMLVCCVASGTSLLGFGDKQRWPLFVGVTAVALLGIGAGFVSARRARA